MKVLRLLPAFLALAGLAARCPGERRRSEPPASTGSPESIVDLAALSAQLSEPGGYFDTDNLVSNETSYLQVADQLADSVRAGEVYLGVGPDQNFSYIARTRPRYAFILDIRPQNRLEHLLFAALFARADDAYHYLCLLFSRACPAETPAAAGGGIEHTLAAVELAAPSEAAFATNLRTAYQYIEGGLHFALTPEDRRDIEKTSRAFFEEQADIRFRTFGRPAGHHPTYRALLLGRSPDGRFGSFLDTPEDYRFVRDLSRARRIVPVVGDFAGPHALPAIGDWVRSRGLGVSAFYTSNVEFYLLRDGGFERFLGNVRDLPSGPDSAIIRACFDYGFSAPAALPGHRSVTLLERLPRFLERAPAGLYGADRGLCTLDPLQ
jgi:hypothetical protein